MFDSKLLSLREHLFPTVSLGIWGEIPSSREARISLSSGGEEYQGNFPLWFRVLCRFMPRTALAMIELETAHRTKGPLDMRLRGAMRWTTAIATGSKYGAEQALFDLREAGETVERLTGLENRSLEGWSETDCLAIEMAWWMAVDSESFSDEQFEKVRLAFGDRVVAAMVLHCAFWNFQDRLFISLGISEAAESEQIGAIHHRFVDSAWMSQTLEPIPVGGSVATDDQKASFDRKDAPVKVESDNQLNWLDYDGLQSRIESQRNRSSRLIAPAWETIARGIPENLFRNPPSDMTWYTLALGYASELAVPFEYYLRVAATEVNQAWDRVFGMAVFWMVTNSVKCPYCMGHCEMNWEVFGLSQAEIAETSRRLAHNEWGSYRTEQQNALDFARKLTQTPYSISNRDLVLLQEGFGEAWAMRIALQCSRYNYMVRISNGFNLALEKENVFYRYYGLSAKDR